LPPPEGAASTKRHPEAGGALVGWPSFIAARHPIVAIAKRRPLVSAAVSLDECRAAMVLNRLAAAWVLPSFPAMRK